MVTQENDIIRPAPAPEDQFLAKVYFEVGVPTDRLPYTKEFEYLVSRYAAEFDVNVNQSLRHDVFLRLANLRKAGKLPRLTTLKTEVAQQLEF